MIPVVLVMAERQRSKVERLVAHCAKLDDTKIEVIEYGEEKTENRWLAAHLSFRKACELFRSEQFFWIEADSIPLRAGWADAIREEHEQSKKSFTLPSLDGLSGYDHSSGIGIYPAHAHYIIPQQKPAMPYLAWDHYIYSKRRDFINMTRLIQHSYGVYDWCGALTRRHSFPDDNAILREDALMFHADPTQSLIK